MKTQDELLNEMLSAIPSDLDKREHSPIYSALAPMAAMLSEVMFYGDQIADSTLADTATGLCLTKACAEFGVARLAATAAMRRAVFLPGTVAVAIGSRFGAEGLVYVVREALADGGYRTECESTGAAGNSYTGAILPLDNLNPSLESAALTDVLVYGTEEESDETLRNRFFNEARYPEHGWNKQGYRKEIKKIAGVGDVVVFPTPGGQGGRITCVIVDPYNKPASAVLIHTVQTLLDPAPQGEGNGMVPPGHTVTIRTVAEKAISVTASVAVKAGFTISGLQASIEAAITDYLAQVAFSDSIVRLSRVETAILNVPGVVDVGSTKINGSIANITLSATATNYEVPRLGMVTLEVLANV